MGNKIKAEIIADSICPRGHRLTTFVLTFPRFILAELNTHRLFSRNSASSRAIPFEKMVKMVEEDPFIPIAWQKDHKGMQGSEYISEKMIQDWSVEKWLESRDNAVNLAKQLNQGGVTKQLCNRLLEPFMWHTVILTASEFDNFFELRCPKYEYSKDIYFKSRKDYENYYEEIHNKANDDRTTLDWLSINKGQSEIHMMELAECMRDARNESIPKQLQAGEWHIPFGDRIDNDRLEEVNRITNTGDYHPDQTKTKIATARCARVSYLNFEGKDDYEADIKLYNTLLASGHFSPFEHCAQVMDDEEYNNYYKGYLCDNGTQTYAYPESKGWCNNFRGFIQYRHLIENGNK